MDTRRSGGRVQRRASGWGAAALVAVLALGLGACGSSGGGSDASDDGGADCGLLGDYLIPVAGLSEADGGEPREQPETLDEEMEVSRSIGEQLPPELAERWSDLIDAVEDESSGGEPMADAEAQELFTVYADATAWAVEQCPDVPPAWKCPTQAKFEQVGEAIDADGETESAEDGVEDPDEVLATYTDADEAVVLDESDRAILWGWLDENGMVVRSEQADLEDGLWTSGSSLECAEDAGLTGGDSGEFETVDEPISD